MSTNNSCDALEEISCETESHHPPARVLFVVDDTEKSRNSTRLSALLTRLKRFQVRALVVVIEDYGEATEQIQAKSVTVVSLEMPRARRHSVVENIGAMLRLKALVKKSSPDFIQAFGPRAERMARVVGASLGLTVLVTGLPVEASSACGRMTDMLLGLGCPPPIRLLQAEDERLILAETRPRTGPLRILGTGVDISRARSAVAIGVEELPDDRYYIGLPLRSGRSAMLKPMLEAFRAVAAWKENACLVLLTEGQEVELRPWLDDMGLGGRVLQHDPGHEPATILRRLQLLWAHDRPRPDQDMMLRAMALGIPVVCDHDTGLAGDIREIGGALMRDARWPRQFAEATREIIENPELSLALSRAGRVLVEERHDINRQAQGLRRVYDELLPARSASGA